MVHALLLGAGFTRNWKGWLAGEMIGELLGRLHDDRETYEELRKSNSFETTLGDLQIEAEKGRDGAVERLERMQRAILETFGNMNAALAQTHTVNFAGVNDHTSTEFFLGLFDCIFTLNQDSLMEFAYTGRGNARWSGVCFPGIDIPPIWNELPPEGRLPMKLTLSEQWDVPAERQPIYKLHGSVNWRSSEDETVLVIGGGKAKYIERQPLLRRYAEEFKRVLFSGGAKLMIIGYGFQDPHINAVLVEASRKHGLSVHIVDPQGLGVLKDSMRGLIRNCRSDLEETLRVVGVGSRPLLDAFSHDALFRSSLHRFFA